MFNFSTVKSIAENVSFQSVSWPEILALATHPKKSRAHSIESAKRNSPLVAAHCGLTRKKIEAEGSLFGLLRADLDDAVGQTKESIADALKEQGVGSFVIYSTLSHRPEIPRYRVFVELAEPVTFSTWQDLQFELAELLESDPCVNRASQFMLLPVVIADAIDEYVYLIEDGPALSSSSPFWVNAMLRAAKHQAEVQEAERAQQHAPASSCSEPLVGNQVSIIDLVNNAYDWPDLLAHYGYKARGRNTWTAPESTTGSAGVHLLTSSTDGKQRIYSHHTSDPAGGRLCDKFDLITIRNFEGDYRQALKQIAEKIFPDAHRYNRKEWQIAQSIKQAETVFGGVES